MVHGALNRLSAGGHGDILSHGQMTDVVQRP